ncbi:MAG: hypothetical protein Aurels2KO_32290 [Aureliella sp.]
MRAEQLEKRRLLAADLIVTTDADIVDANDGLVSLREALAFANSDPDFSEITFGDGSSVAGGTNFEDATPDVITLGGTQLVISSDVTINGPGAELLTVSGNDASRVFEITVGDFDVEFDSLTIANGNSGNVPGGGIRNQSSGNVTVADAAVTANNAVVGAGIYHINGTLTIQRTTISQNSSQLRGGGLEIEGGEATITDTSISGNSSVLQGGGIWVIAATVTVNGSTISENSSEFLSGGGIENYGSTTLINSTVSGNSAPAGGGIQNGRALTLINSTITGNVAVAGGGGGIRSTGTVSTTINNSIVAGNEATSDPDVFGQLVANNSLIGGAITDILDPNLADNGGLTLTHALLPGSPAINAGDNALAVDANGDVLATDQRGVNRFVGTVDIGAVEYKESASLVVTTAVDLVDAYDNLTSLREALTFANSDPDFSEITFGDGSSLSEGTDFTDATADVITLGGTQLEISSDVTINGPGAELLTVSGNQQSRVFDVIGGEVTFDLLSIADGRAGNGAGIYIAHMASATISNSTIRENAAIPAPNIVDPRGGGLYVAGTLALTQSLVTKNHAGRTGGGIFGVGTMTITDTTVSENTSEGAGGGVGNKGILRLNGGAILENSALGGGGGGVFNDGDARIANTTISGNDAGESGIGGGIRNFFSLAIVNVTITENSGGGLASTMSISASNNIIAGNTGENDAQFHGPFALDLSNLIQDDASAVIGPLADNGGPTLTHALLPDSPAINAGDNSLAVAPNGDVLTTDQRGESRLVGTVDIGAFEAPANTNWRPIDDITVAEDAADQVVDLSMAFADSANVTLSASSGDNSLVYATISGTDLNLSFEANHSGSTTVTVQATADGVTTESSFLVTVTPVTDLTADDDTFSGMEDITLSGSVAGNDSTISGGALEFAVETNPAFGSVVMNVDGSFDYTPDANFNGSDSFTYRVIDAASGEELVQTVWLTIAAVGDDGTFGGDLSKTTDEDVSTAGVVTFEDTADGYSVSNFSLTSAATNGTASVDSDGNWTYQPNTNFFGSDSFAVSVVDDDGNVETQIISLAVNSVADLTAEDDAFSGTEDTTISASVADNASTTSGGALEFAVETNPAFGSVVMNADGIFDYTPDANFNGSDSFTYRVIDAASGEELIQTASLTIAAVGDDGTFGGDLSKTTDEDVSTAGTITFEDAADGYSANNFNLTSAATNGTASVDSDGNWTYQPNADFFGSDSFTVSVTDEAGNVETQVIGLTVSSVNDAPTATDTFADFAVDEGAADQSFDLTTYFADVDHPTLTYSTTSSSGSVVATVDENQLHLSFPTDGSTTITVTATDADGASVSQTFEVTVNDVAGEPTPGVTVVDGKLTIIGTDGDDYIKVKKFWGSYYVLTNIEGHRYTRMNASDVDTICIDGADGHDSIVMGLFVRVPTELYGGSGNDYIHGGLGADLIDGGDGDDCLHGSFGNDTILGGDGNDWIDGGFGHDTVFGGIGNDRIGGGSGNDILLGQAGDDVILGGSGEDILIGGTGADRLYGQSHGDLLVTGDTNWDNDETALNRLRDLWTGSSSISARRQSILDEGLEVIHDNDRDRVWGGYGRDWALTDDLDS